MQSVVLTILTTSTIQYRMVLCIVLLLQNMIHTQSLSADKNPVHTCDCKHRIVLNGLWESIHTSHSPTPGYSTFAAKKACISC